MASESNIVDFDLTANEFGLYDIALDSDGDISSVQSFDTAILMSLFEEKRADSSEVAITQNRRGYWGNEFYQDVADREQGSKIWLYEQARLNQDTINGIDDATNDCLLWLVEQQFIKSIDINVNSQRGVVVGNVSLVRFNSQTESKSFILWENTGK